MVSTGLVVLGMMIALAEWTSGVEEGVRKVDEEMGMEEGGGMGAGLESRRKGTNVDSGRKEGCCRVCEELEKADGQARDGGGWWEEGEMDQGLWGDGEGGWRG